jgi:hypothetical protein
VTSDENFPGTLARVVRELNVCTCSRVIECSLLPDDTPCFSTDIDDSECCAAVKAGSIVVLFSDRLMLHGASLCRLTSTTREMCVKVIE